MNRDDYHVLISSDLQAEIDGFRGNLMNPQFLEDYPDSLNEARQQSHEEYLAEKEKVGVVVAILQDWWLAKQDGTANNRYPSPDCQITQDEADKQVHTLDDYSIWELAGNWHWHNEHNGTEVPWNFFDYLEPHARIAMVEELWKAKGVIE